VPAGLSFLGAPGLGLAALLGAAVGMGGFAFVYAKGASYLTDDPTACANCHAMQAHEDGWRRGPHHAAAVCNDCHTPAEPLARYVVKALNGWSHSRAFTTGHYPDAIQPRERSRAVVESQCRHCHGDIVASMEEAGDVSCVRCHDSVGHLR
jgi:cytochrome c nitrite reductase small subunit